MLSSVKWSSWHNEGLFGRETTYSLTTRCSDGFGGLKTCWLKHGVHSIQAIYLTPISTHDVMMTPKIPSIPIPVYLISRICEFILMSTWLVSLNDVNKAKNKILECVCVCLCIRFPPKCQVSLRKHRQHLDINLMGHLIWVNIPKCNKSNINPDFTSWWR